MYGKLGVRAASHHRRVSHDLVIALAGGAIGAVLAAIGFAVLRLSAVPGEVARHDRRARALDEDLERWVADDHRKLRQELDRTVNDYSGRGLLYSGALIGALAHVKSSALQRYTDRHAETVRAFDDLLAAESGPHEMWRRARRRGPLALRSPGRVEPVIDEWRTDVRRFGMDAAEVYDPTRWTTEDLVRDVHERPLEPPDDSTPPVTDQA